MEPRDLDPASLRAFVRRDWNATADLDLLARASQPIEQKLRIAEALYEAARATVPGWPSEADRLADLEHHIAVRRLLERAAHVRPR